MLIVKFKIIAITVIDGFPAADLYVAEKLVFHYLNRSSASLCNRFLKFSTGDSIISFLLLPLASPTQLIPHFLLPPIFFCYFRWSCTHFNLSSILDSNFDFMDVRKFPYTQPRNFPISFLLAVLYFQQTDERKIWLSLQTRHLCLIWLYFCCWRIIKP